MIGHFRVFFWSLFPPSVCFLGWVLEILMLPDFLIPCNVIFQEEKLNLNTPGSNNGSLFSVCYLPQPRTRIRFTKWTIKSSQSTWASLFWHGYKSSYAHMLPCISVRRGGEIGEADEHVIWRHSLILEPLWFHQRHANIQTVSLLLEKLNDG